MAKNAVTKSGNDMIGEGLFGKAGLPASFDTFSWAKILEGDDSITGTDRADSLKGHDGDDTLVGLAGDDTLDGGDGFDTADFSDPGHSGGGVINLNTGSASFDGERDVLKSIENVIASQGDDTVVGDGGANRISGEHGDDVMFGGGGADTIDGGGGRDVMQGGAGTDHLDGGDGDDFANGGNGDDEIHGGEGDDTLYGGAGDDRLYGDNGDDVLVGGAGNDSLSSGFGVNGLDGGDGDDVFFYYRHGRNYVVTGSGEDLIATNERTKGLYQVSDFDLAHDSLQFDAKGDEQLTVDELMESGRLTVTGSEDHTLISFGRKVIDLIGVDVAEFDPHMIYVI